MTTPNPAKFRQILSKLLYTLTLVCLLATVCLAITRFHEQGWVLAFFATIFAFILGNILAHSPVKMRVDLENDIDVQPFETAYKRRKFS